MTQEPQASRLKRLIIFAAVVTISFLILKAFFHQEPDPKPTLPSATKSNDEVSLEALAPERHARSASPVTATLPPPTKSLAQIFANDDLCELERYLYQKQSEPNARSYQALAEDAYFKTSNFKDGYEEYSIAVSGLPGARTNHGRFLSALRMANWIEGGPPFEGLVDVPRAARDLLQLARDDSGNAAPAAFALAIDPSKATDELYQLIEQADRFDSYQIGYLREMSDQDDPRAAALIIKISHLATLRIPNWTKFRLNFSEATQNKTELRLHVTDLMIANAKQAKVSSRELGFNVLEAATARSLAGGARSYPTFKEIDDAFPNSSAEDFPLAELLPNDPTGACSPDRIEKIRAYSRDLKSRGARLGVAF